MRLKKYLQYKWLFVLGALTKLVEVILELCLPIFMGIMLDQGLADNNLSLAYLMIGIVAGFAILGFLSTLFSHILIAKVTQDFARNLKNAIFNQGINLSYQDSNLFSSTTLVNRMNNDTLTLQNTLAMTMRIATRAPFLMFGSIIAIFIISTSIAIILVTGYLVMILLISLVVFGLLKKYQKVQKIRDQTDQITRENLTGSKVIKSFGKVEFEQERFHQKNDQLIQEQKSAARLSALSTPITTLVLNISLVIMLYVSAGYINLGYLSQGQTLALVSYTGQLVTATIAFLNLILLYARAVVSYKRVTKVLDYDGTIKNDGVKDFDHAPIDIEFNQVDVYFPSHENPILKNLNFKIKAGQKVGIVGLTGSGKSTLLRVIARLIEPTNGLVTIQNKKLVDLEIHNLHAQIGFVNQSRQLLNGTIASNLKMGIERLDEELLTALTDAQYPLSLNELDDKVIHAGANYSGGQCQRISVARALVRQPKILLLDDIFSALDYQTDKQLRKSLRALDYRPTIVIASQRLSSLVDADQIILLDQGEIVAMGTHQELMKSSLLYQQLYLSQQREGN